MMNGCKWMEMYFLMMRTIKYAETAIFLAVISASACAIGEECGWRRVCEVPETQIEWEETPSHVRSLSRLVGALDIGLSNGLPASDFGRIKELARALDHDPDKCYRYVRDNIAYASYAGLLKGPERTLLDREGNELDQSFLLLALLRASGFTDAGIGYAPLTTSNGVLTSCFLLPLRAQESASEYNAADWLGVDASGYESDVASRVMRLHNLAGHYNKCFYVGVGGAPYLAMDHFFVTLPTPGGTDLMDPSVKPSKKKSPCDAISDSGYSRSALLSAAGGTVADGYVQNLSKSSLAAYLDGLQAALRSAWTNENSAASRFVGESHAVAQAEDDDQHYHGTYFGLQRSLLEQPDYIKDHYRAKATLRIGSAILADFFLDEVGERLLWLSFEESGTEYPKAVLRLDDAIIFSESGGSPSNVAPLTVSVSYPTASADTLAHTYAITRGVSNVYAVVIGFGGDSPSGIRKIASQDLAEIVSSGSPTSAEALARSLSVAGQQWISQVSMCSRLRSRTCAYSIYDYYNIGVVGCSGSTFLDFGNRFGYFSNLTPDIEGEAFFSSALEHAVLDQLNGAENPSVSTVSMLDAANAAGVRLYFATSNNCASVVSALSGYEYSVTSNIQRRVYGGCSALLPQSSIVTVNGWTGYGYVLQDHVNWVAGMIISSGKNGGYCTVNAPPSALTYIKETSTVLTSYGSVNQSLSADPVVMPDGAYYDEVTDISVPGGTSLNWTRYYDSRQRNHSGGLGYGWHHGFEATVAEVSDPDAFFGDGSVEAVIPTAIANAVVNDMLIGEWGTCSAGEMARRWTLAAMVAQWWTERTTGSSVVVTLGARSLRFSRLEDGTFAPAPGVTATLDRKIDGTYVLAERHGSTYDFNSDGQLASIIDPSGNITALTYSSGHLTSVSNSFGAVLSMAWTDGRISCVTDSAGRSVSYSYDSEGRLSEVSDVRGMSTAYGYDPGTGALTTKTDALGNVLVSNTYNEFGQVTNQVSDANGVWKFGYCGPDAAWDEAPDGGRRNQSFDGQGRVLLDKARDGGWTGHAYDGHGHLVSTSNRFGRVETYYYGADDLLLASKVNVEGHETAFAYDGNLRIAEITNAVGGVTRFSYDGSHRLTRVETADGSVVSNEWTAAGLLSAQTVFSADGVALRRKELVYSSAGLPVSKTVWGVGLPSVGVTELYSYDSARRLVARTDANGHVTSFTYDNAGNMLSKTAPDGAVSSFAYDYAGRLVSVTDALGRTTSVIWTPSGKPASTVCQDGGITTNVYDSSDRLIASTDERGTTAYFEYDAAGRVVRRIDPAGTTSFVYNLAGLESAETNALGGVTFADYDFACNPVVSSNASGRAHWFAYDGVDRIVATSNSIGRVRRLAYDAVDRLASTARPSGAQDAFGYDPFGNCTVFTNAEGHIYRMSYDALGRMISATNALGECVFSASYDGAGNLLSRTDGEGNATMFGYDPRNRLSSRASADGVDAFSYDLVGNLLSASNSVAVETFAYDMRDRLTNAVTRIGTNEWMTSWARDAGGLVTNIAYVAGKSVVREYDAAGRLVSVRDWLGNEWTFSWNALGRQTGGTSPDGRQHLFAYDSYGELTAWSVSGIAGRTIERDVEGRRIKDTVAAGPVPAATFKRNAQNTFDAADRLVAATAAYEGSHIPVDETFLYNGNGALTNATSSGEVVFGAAYDAQGRLASLGSNAFAYDALGNRVLSSGHIFIPDHSDPLKRPLVECDANGELVRWYIWGPGRLLGFIDADGNLTVAHSDEQGSVIALTDISGAILFRASYSPYGEDWGSSGTNATPFAWLGGCGVKRVGGEATVPSAFGQLYLTRHRLYSPVLRRFLSADPMGIDGGLNLYMYANGNPLVYIDPLGLCAESMSGTITDYLKASVNQVVKGNYTDDVTLLGTAGEVALGIAGLDLPMDVRDITYDLTNWEWSWSHAGKTTVDVIALLPVIGSLKYADEAETLFKRSAEGVKSSGSGARFSDDASALIDLSRHSRKGVSETDAETLLEWAKEYNLPAHGPERHMNRKFKDEHIHIGPVDHIKIDK